MRLSCRLGIFLSAFLSLISVSSVALSHERSTVKKSLNGEMWACISRGQDIYLAGKVNPDAGGMEAIKKLLAKPGDWKKFIKGEEFRIPLLHLRDSHKHRVISALFPKDRLTSKGWLHQVRYTYSGRSGGETLWRISEWFTGKGINHKKLTALNKRRRRSLIYKGDKVLIPETLLSPAFARNDLASVSRNGDLEFKSDELGEYALYKLKRGEALYSAVILRFTERIYAKDVLEAAEIVRGRSEIRDVKKMRPGAEVKIPVELLSDEFRPKYDPVRMRYDTYRDESDKFTHTVKARNLEGITVILDGGHGGVDIGAMGCCGDVYEDEISYDIMCRIKRNLEEHTKAEVLVTVMDESDGYRVNNGWHFSQDTDEFLLTHPTYRITGHKTSVHLRWYLANHLYKKLVNEGVDPERVVFSSFHADALHPALSGVMIYVPSAYYSRGTHGRQGEVYRKRTEVRAGQYVSFSRKERMEAEGLSRKFAAELLRAFRKHDVDVHNGRPIRDYVLRRGRKWVPAVIRGNAVPTKVLIEVVNLKNPQDCEKIRNPIFRESVAEAYTEALIQYFDERVLSKVSADQSP